MTAIRVHSSIWIGVLVMVASGCAATEESGRRSEEDRGTRVAEQREGLHLADPHPDVRTVQLFRTGDEAALPILPMRGAQTLTLRFDLMGNDPRPVSIYFYHATRTWRRDLVPAEYLTSFHRDDILDYESSHATFVPYVHYEYGFPNEDIGFRLSGNYIIRVTEQGMEEAVLFERPFYVSEQAAGLDFGLNDVRVTGQPFPATQPTVRFTPPDATTGTAFDYTVCFQRNGRVQAERCTDRPALDYQPALRYFLEPETSFLAEAADFWLDLSNLRIGGRIERTDLVSTPWQITLEPDYFRFPGTALAPLQNGQIVVDEVVRGLNDPGSDGEYVRVNFALVPDGDQRLPGRIWVVGAFSGWEAIPEGEMTWRAENARYEGSLLLKQGAYEYRYAFSDPAVAGASLGASPRFDNMISAFVYRNDMRVGTDRLISAVSVVTR